jgi:fructose-1,6-bisphosphatase II
VSGDTSLATVDPTGPLDLAVLEAVALAATRDAAVACQPLVGRGDKYAADHAATEAMRAALAAAPGVGTVVIGEGEKDGAPMLYNGERVGAGGVAFDIAVDPLECTTFCAKGLPGSLATIALRRGRCAAAPGPFPLDGEASGPARRARGDGHHGRPEARPARIAAALENEIAELRPRQAAPPRVDRAPASSGRLRDDTV